MRPKVETFTEVVNESHTNLIRYFQKYEGNGWSVVGRYPTETPTCWEYLWLRYNPE
jgi:hypothetical protein